MRLLTLLFTLLVAQLAHAGAVITYHGRLIAPSGDPVVSSNVSFNIRVLSPQTMGSCVLYEEQRTLNMSASDGVFVIPIGDGSGVRTSNDPGFQIEKVFTNSAGTVFNKPSAWDSSKYFCNSGSSYTPSSLDGRQLVVSFKDGSGAWQVLPNMDVTFVPFAVSSYDAQNIGGTPSANVLRVSGSSAAPLSAADYLELQKLIDGSSSSFGGGGSGSVTSVIAGSGLSGGTITSSGTIAIAASGVGTSHLADSSVTNAKLASGSVTNDKVVSIDWSKVTSVPTAIQNAGSDITALQNSVATTNSNLSTTNTNVSNLTTAVNGKITQPSSCTSGQLLSFVSVTDWTCVNAPSSSDKLPLAGGTMAGTLNMGAQAINNALSVQAGVVSTHAVLLSGTVPTTPPEGALWYDAGVLKYRGPSSDIAVGTAGSQWQDVSNGIASTKLLGVGNNLPVAGGYPNFHLSIDSKNDNVSARGINTSLYQTSTASGSYSNLAGVFKAQEVVAENVTNSGALSGLWTVAFRNNQPGFIDKGTLNELVGERVQYGHYNSEATATPLTTEAYGLKLLPYYRTGTIGTMYDFYSHPGAAGGAVTKHYGFYIAGAQKFNYLEGKLGVGTTTPTEALEVVGKVKATELCIGSNCISAWPSGASSGTVTEVSAGTGLTTTAGATSSGGNVTTTGTLNLTNTGVTPGVYGSATSVPVFEVDAQGRIKTAVNTSISGVAPSGSAGGDLGGTYPSPSVDKIKGQAVSATATADGQVLRFSGSSWAPSSVRLSELASATGVAGSAFNATSCTASQTLNWSSITDKLECQNIASLNASVLTAGTIDAARLPASASYWQSATGGINFSGGNVGIGSSNPSSLLDVAGTIKSQGLTVGQLTTSGSNTSTNSSITLGGYQLARIQMSSQYDGGGWVNYFMGYNSGNTTNTGSFNYSYGSNSLRSLTTGISNIAIGYNTLLAVTTGSANTTLGRDSYTAMVAGGSNVGLGSQAGRYLASGSNNTLVGAGAGSTLADGSNATSSTGSVLIGSDTRYLVNGSTNEIVIGSGAIGNGSNSLTLGSNATTKTIVNGSLGVNTTSPGSKLEVNGTIRAGEATPTSGSVMMTDVYGNGNLTTFGTEYSSGAPLIGYGVRASSAAATFKSSTGSALVRSALALGGSEGVRFYNSVSQTVAADSAITLSESMRITNSGNVGIGTSAPTEKLQISGNLQINSSTTMNSTGNAGGIRIYNSQSANSDYLNIGWMAEDLQGIQSSDGSTHKSLALNPYGGYVGILLGNAAASQALEVGGNIKANGCIYYNSSSTGTCASDARIKTDVHSFDLGLDVLLGIDPVYFKYNGLAGFKKDGQEQLGVIAQQVEKVAPSLVKRQMVQLHEDDKEKTEIKVVDYGAFTYVVINAVKELYAKLIGQEERVNLQSRQIASIENQKADKGALADANAKIKVLEAQNAEKAKELDAMKAYLCAKDPSAPICK